jgi:hypothetical protein
VKAQLCAVEEVSLTTKSIIVVVIVAAAVLALWGAVIVIFRRQSQRRALRDRFGPDYSRTVGRTGSKKRAEADLKNRVGQRESLAILPLGPAQRDRYQQEWRQVQATFVDAPGTALGQADSLITRVMIARGYPVQDFEERADLVSVDHPQVVEHYRRAHGIYLASQAGGVATEEMREAFVSFRSLFSELVGDGRPDVGTITTEPAKPSPT